MFLLDTWKTTSSCQSRKKCKVPRELCSNESAVRRSAGKLYPDGLHEFFPVCVHESTAVITEWIQTSAFPQQEFTALPLRLFRRQKIIQITSSNCLLLCPPLLVWVVGRDSLPSSLSCGEDRQPFSHFKIHTAFPPQSHPVASPCAGIQGN